jgi:hypothetical protein
VAIGTNALAGADGATAIGLNARATGVNAIAIGTGAVATGSIAIGTGASASGGGAAFGDNAVATGSNATAIGPGAQAQFTNSAAFGSGAKATRGDQQMFGTAGNTYTMPGLTSAASKAQQVGPLQIVTSDSGGNLATNTAAGLGLATTADIAGLNGQIGGLQSEINALGRRDKELADGIAVSLALSQPVLPSGKTVALNLGWGNFEGSNGFGATGALVFTPNWNNTAVVLHGGVGVGTDTGSVGSRAGLTFAW